MKFTSLSSLRSVALLLAAVAVAFGQAAQPAPPAQPEPTAQPADPTLRRLDDPTAEAAPTEKKAPAAKKKRNVRAASRDGAPFGNQIVAAGRTVHEAVAISGSIDVEGTVQSDAVAVLGSVRVAPGAKVGQAAVAVLGRVEMLGSTRDVVSVLGGTSEINGPASGEVVVVLGSLKLGPKAVIEDDVTVVGGQLIRDPEAVVKGSIHHVSVPGLGDFEWLVTWLRECAMLARPLGFHGQLGWAWAIAFGFLGFYLLLALLFGGNVTKCAETFERRPAMSILASVLTVLLSPVVFVILALTIVGGLLVPFLAAALFFAGLFGKVVMLAWIGRRFTKFFGDGPLGGPVFAVLVGGLVVMLIYTIPFVGFATYKLLTWLGLGVVVLTIAEAMRRNKRPPAAATPSGSVPLTPPPAPAPSAPVAAMTAPASMGFVGTPPPAPAAVEPAPAPAPEVEPNPAVSGFAVPAPAYVPRAAMPAPAPQPRLRPAIDETTLPRANLLIRLAALALDGILVGVLLGMLSSMTPRFFHFHDGPGGFLLVLALYGAALWKTKGTTIGGIVCGLKVVRLDGREFDWPTAVVRALGCFLSMVVAGLGFIWIAFDDEQQSWHDKIAGTIVVRVPKGTSLV
ncbi:MAG: RDD family protein [Opitutaceae bacterium]|nr:RDD family protein [Opitutaceae bacterium]